METATFTKARSFTNPSTLSSIISTNLFQLIHREFRHKNKIKNCAIHEYCVWNKTQINPISRYLIWCGMLILRFMPIKRFSHRRIYIATMPWCWWWYLCAWLLSCCEPFHGHLNSMYNGNDYANRIKEDDSKNTNRNTVPT